MTLAPMTTMDEVRAVLWKEWREIARQRSTRIGAVVVVVMFGVVLPLQGGAEFFRSPLQLISWGILPFALTIPTIADSFAGERERHTLETLLATRLSERGILLGKIAMALSYSLGGTLVTMGLSIVVASAAASALVAPSLAFFVAGAALALAIALLAASGGVLVSLRASTVRQAQQIMGFAFMGIFFGGQILFATLDKGALLPWLVRTPVTTIILTLAAAVLALDLVLLAICRAAFQRSKLLLD